MSNTDVELFIVPWENDYKHVLYFGSLSEQNTYFTNKTSVKHSGLTYQRKDNVIRFPAHIDTIYNMNYARYRNNNYSNKWYYAFITDMVYVNDGMTEIHLETDVMQTYLDEANIMPCYVEREHCLNDTIGFNLVDEGLGTGEYTCNLHAQMGYADPLVIIVGVTEDKDGKTLSGQIYNGIYSGIKYYCFNNTEGGRTDLKTFIDDYGDGKAEAIVCMFLAPKKLVDTYVSGTQILESNKPMVEYIQVDDSGINDKFKPDFTKLNGYKPRNNKLHTYPYRYLYVSNNSGGDVIYKYENWTPPFNTKPAFEIQGCLTPGCSVRLVPWYYKGTAINDSEGLNLGKFPSLNWTSDYFTNWLTQNGVNIGVSAVSSVASIVGGVALASTGVGAGIGGAGILSGVTSLANTLGDIHKGTIIPNQASGNLNAGDVVTASKRNDFHFYDMSVKYEMCEVIDKFFDMYGYRTLKYKLPNSNHRKAYWYTKTINCDIVGALPNKDIQKIKNIYDSGVTFWRNEDNIGNYATDNGIL